MSNSSLPGFDWLQIKRQIREKVRPTLTQLNARELKERRLFLALSLAVVMGGTFYFLIDPLSMSRSDINDKISAAEKEVKNLDLAANKIRQNPNLDPDKLVRDERDRLQKKLRQLQGQIDALAVDLISPTEMAKVLENMLNKETDLVLEGLETLPAEPVVKSLTKETEATANGGRYFRHGVVLRLRGGYFSTLSYLKTLEDLPWDFFWDEIDYEVQSYPEALVTIRIHTLSTKAGWIGV